VQDRLLAATIPFYGYTGPIGFGYGALVGSIFLLTYAVADREVSGLCAGHFVVKPARLRGVVSSLAPYRLSAKQRSHHPAWI
jgi:hypothetical protein